MRHLLIILWISVFGTARTLADPGDATTRPSDAIDPRVASILEAFESAGRAVDTIECKVKYFEEDRLNLTESTKFGLIRFKRTEPNPTFLIEFNKIETDGIVMRDRKWWLFRDRWLIEAAEKSRTIIKREILRPGETEDFFDLETAPFPVPFGQRKEQILEHFNVALVDPQVDDPEHCDHLVCRPKETSRLAEDYHRMDFYISRDLHLPLRIVTEDPRHEQIRRADFPDLTKSRINVEMPDDSLRLPSETNGYQVSEEPLQD